MKRAIIVLVLRAVVAAGAGAWYLGRDRTEVEVNSVPVTRGDIIDSVGATGTVQAVTTVQVGSQVSGNIEWLGADFNSVVREGQVIARIDPATFQAQLERAEARPTDSPLPREAQRHDAQCEIREHTHPGVLAKRAQLHHHLPLMYRARIHQRYANVRGPD